MNTELLQRHFDRIGARIEIEERKPVMSRFWQPPVPDFQLDIRRGKTRKANRQRSDDRFVLTVKEAVWNELDVAVLQTRPELRQLLVMTRQPDKPIERFLCGFDEREWFVAATPGQVSTVDDAKESLKPNSLRLSQANRTLKAREKHSRHNRVFLRQGEWFFTPSPDVFIDDRRILRNEPISRGRGSKPHEVAEVCRTGGEPVYVNFGTDTVLSEEIFNRTIKANPSKRKGWQQMRRNPGVYARGTVRHPDHKALQLQGWHRVEMNAENEAPGMSHVAFFD